MRTLHALLIGGGLFSLSLIVMLYRGTALPGRLVAVALIALLTSGASALHATQRHAGTGNLISRGYPKPFHFQWRDFEGQGGTRRDVNFAYFAVNSIVHAGVLSLIAAIIPRRRERKGATRMPAGMVVVRIALGIFLLILAVIGGFIPILQGWIFFLLAILVLFPKAKFTEKILHKAEPKVPRVVRFLRRLGIGSEEPQRDTIQTE